MLVSHNDMLVLIRFFFLSLILLAIIATVHTQYIKELCNLVVKRVSVTLS